MLLPHAEKDTRKLATTVTFLLNITQVGTYACLFASSLQFVDIPEGVTSINDSSFFQCRGLKVIKFPRSLRKIGFRAFRDCTGLERVDLGEVRIPTETARSKSMTRNAVFMLPS